MVPGIIGGVLVAGVGIVAFQRLASLAGRDGENPANNGPARGTGPAWGGRS